MILNFEDHLRQEKAMKHNSVVLFEGKWHKTEEECCAEKLTGLKVTGRSLAQDVRRDSALPASCFLHRSLQE